MQKCLLLVCAGLLGAVWAEDAYRGNFKTSVRWVREVI